ncbi:MAG TPA: uridine diphosphate-N-acetylglucosamine-binding protein YvcK [Thermoanaerobaculia bacterium]|nr:uridine diphosphate-N-acetylglucosamine-binding protein YvcK [Thermoanaerobaculia bacterium]
MVAIGGGSGLSVLLRGLKHHVVAGDLASLDAVVTVADDGGSSGRLRRDYAMPAPGDIRSCIVALADDEGLLAKLFEYRFGETGDLAGHSFGNLFLAALAGVTGDFYQAIVETEHILSVRGRILPATVGNVNLRGVGVSGKVYAGESAIGKSGEQLAHLAIEPADPPAFPLAVEAILDADLVVLGPGSLYTSILPNLMIPGIREAVRETPARVLLLMNLMTQPGETDDMDAVAHLAAIERWAEPGLVDAVLVNAAAPRLPLLDLYEKEGAAPVLVDERAIAEHGVQVWVEDLLGEGALIRHDSDKLARAVLALARPEHDPAADPVVVATRAALRERRTP